MSSNLAKHFNMRKTNQTQPIPGKSMVQNSAGGYSFELDKWDYFQRFLILGSEGGTYYANERNLTIENAENTIKCIQENPKKAVDIIVDVSTNGRAAKQDATLFALALACSVAPEADRKVGYDAIFKVCRTGTHLFTFTNYIKSMRGWSRGLRNGVSKFYTQKPLDKLELQVVKYRNRAGYTHRDVMRLAHPATTDTKRNSLLKYAAEKMNPENANITEYSSFMTDFGLVSAFEEAKRLEPSKYADTKKLVKLITDNGLPREGIPNTFLGKPEVWEALLQRMPVNALVRNLGKMSSLDMTRSNMSSATTQIVSLLNNEEAIRKSRIHPMQILTAMKTYGNGHGDKGSLSWTPNQRIIDALDKAFYTSFGNVEKTGLNFMLALDVSGSMTHPIMGSPLSCREASAAMAMITAKVEDNHDFIGFTSGGKNHFTTGARSRSIWGGSGVSQLDISNKSRLQDVIKSISNLPFGGTDCSLPMVYAEKHNIPVDCFVVYTDNETYAGDIHPKQALDSYRQKTGRNAKLVVVGMAANGFTIADPSDPGMLDVVGFDTATPNLITQFALGFDR